jgi:hypothetical protein
MAGRELERIHVVEGVRHDGMLDAAEPLEGVAGQRRGGEHDERSAPESDQSAPAREACTTREAELTIEQPDAACQLSWLGHEALDRPRCDGP